MSCTIQTVGFPFTFIASDNRGNTVTSFSAGSGYMRTGATGGFLYVPQMSGAPSSTGATGYTGMIAMCFDTQNNIPWYLNTNNTFAGSTGPGTISWVPGNGRVLIGSRVLNGDTSSVSFTGIPQIFNNLIITGVARSTTVSVSDNLTLNFNGDTTNTNYWHQFIATANTTTSGTVANDFPIIGRCPGVGIPANCMGDFNCTIPRYSNSSTFKSLNSICGYIGNGTVNIVVRNITSTWANTAPITSINISFPGSNILSGSRIRLYGVW